MTSLLMTDLLPRHPVPNVRLPLVEAFERDMVDDPVDESSSTRFCWRLLAVVGVMSAVAYGVLLWRVWE